MLKYDVNAAPQQDSPSSTPLRDTEDSAPTTLMDLGDSTTSIASLAPHSSNGLSCLATTEDVIFFSESQAGQAVAAWKHHCSDGNSVSIIVPADQQPKETLGLVISNGDPSVLEFGIEDGLALFPNIIPLPRKDRSRHVKIASIATASVAASGDLSAVPMLFVLFEDGSVSIALEQGDALNELHRQQAVEAQRTAFNDLAVRLSGREAVPVPLLPRKVHQFNDYWLRESTYPLCALFGARTLTGASQIFLTALRSPVDHL